MKGIIPISQIHMDSLSCFHVCLFFLEQASVSISTHTFKVMHFLLEKNKADLTFHLCHMGNILALVFLLPPTRSNWGFHTGSHKCITYSQLFEKLNALDQLNEQLGCVSTTWFSIEPGVCKLSSVESRSSSYIFPKIPFEELAAILEIQSLFFKIICEPNLMKIYELTSTFFSTPTSKLNTIQGSKDTLVSTANSNLCPRKRETY